MLEFAAGQVISSALPFMVIASGPQTVNKTRIIEAVITALVVGIAVAYAGIYVALPVIQERLDTLKRDAQETRQLIRDIKMELEQRQMHRDIELSKLRAEFVQMQIDMAKRR